MNWILFVVAVCFWAWAIWIWISGEKYHRDGGDDIFIKAGYTMGAVVIGGIALAMLIIAVQEQ